jgi:hypothetical protein
MIWLSKMSAIKISRILDTFIIQCLTLMMNEFYVVILVNISMFVIEIERIEIHWMDCRAKP